MCCKRVELVGLWAVFHLLQVQWMLIVWGLVGCTIAGGQLSRKTMEMTTQCFENKGAFITI